MIQSILRFAGFNLTPIREIESISLHLQWGWAALVLILLALVPAVFYFYRFEGKNITGSTRKLLLSLRLSWVIILAILITGPIMVITGLIPQQNRLAVMIDTSRSMSIKHEGATRLEQIKKLMDSGFLKKLETRTGIYPDVFAFSENVSPVSRQEIGQFNLIADGNQTDISGATRDVIGNLGEGSLLGTIILTDGVSTIGENPAVALANMRTPVHFVAPGADGETSDMALHLHRPPAMGYLNSSVRVRGEVTLHRIATTSVEIKIRRNGQPHSTIVAKVEAETGRAPFSFSIPCDEEGTFRFDLEIAEQAQELTSDNNRTGFLIKIVRERLNILAISGRLSWDMKFITNALSTDPNARLVHWVQLADNRWVCSRNFIPESAVTRPDLLKDLKDTDVIILNSASHAMLKGIENEIVTRVESGASGLLFLPSTRSFNELGYKGTRFEQLLPVAIDSETWRGNPGNMALPSVEVSYNFLRLVDNPIENVEFFATLPKLDGAYEYSSLKAGSEILLSSTIRGNSGNLPILIKSRAGQGNVVVVAGGPLWPSGFRLVPTDRGFAPFAAMITNMCKWLANRREDAQVSIEQTSSRAYIGTPNTVKIWVLDSKNQLQTNAQVSMTISDEKGNSNQLPAMETSQQGCYEATFVPSFKGLHKLVATARFQGRELGTAESEVLVEVPTAEYDNPVVRHNLMKQLASETRGLFATIDQAEKIINSIESKPGKKLESKNLDVRDSWILLLLVLLLPSLEWYLRRTGGLS